MKYKLTSIILLFLIIIAFLSCLNAQPDNKKPMYGEVPKNEHYKEIDEEFKKNCIKQYGTLDSAAQAHIAFGWEYFCYGDLTTAMKRFNQSWLLNQEIPDVYFGFAALMEMQDNKKEAERFYKIGNQKDTTGERAKICYEIIETCTERLKKKETLN